MTSATTSDYWFSSSALYISLNAVGDYNYIHANCSSGSVIMCYLKGIDGLGYDNAHNFQRWTMVASPTVFHDDEPRYVYIAIPRPTNTATDKAMVVFPSERLDIYGCGEDGETQVGSDQYYYIFTQGVISAPEGDEDSGSLMRTWTAEVNTGTLASDESINAASGEDTWWSWNSVTDKVTFLKNIASAIFDSLEAAYASITQLVLGGTTLNGVANEDTSESSTDTVATPSYVAKKYLSRTHDDTAEGSITFNNSITVKGETLLKETTTIGEFAKNTQVGIGSKAGIQMTPEGDIIARSLELSESLNVPTIKYNEIEVLSGTRWDSAGKGRIKEIISTDDTDHSCQFVLDLNDGEIGEFKLHDILRGFWHNTEDTSQNATETTDDRKGNIQRAGFMSLYCRVTAVANVVERTTDNITSYIAYDDDYTAQDGDTLLENGLVTVQMRQYTDTDSWSAYPGKWSVLSVSGSFSNEEDDKDRQRFTVYTTSYIARFEGVNTWEWEDGTFKGGWGDLTGFSMYEQDEDGNVSLKTFDGSGFVDENIYIYGTLQQFYRYSDSIVISLSRPDGTIADGETLTAQFVLQSISGTVLDSGYTMTITRQSGDTDADAEWDAQMASDYPNGIPASLEFVFSDIPENGAVYVVAASREVSTTTGGTMTYTTSASFALSRAYATEVFMGAWDSETEYTRTTRSYPTVTHYGCKWYLNVDSDTGTEPLPYSTVWRMLYGVDDLTIKFYNSAGQLIQNASCYPGYVNIFLSPHLFCGNIDITDLTSDADWSWTRYTGNYGEETDTREASDQQADEGWPSTHDATREITITNEDMPPTWGSDGKVVNFIVTVVFDGEDVTNYASF